MALRGFVPNEPAAFFLWDVAMAAFFRIDNAAAVAFLCHADVAFHLAFKLAAKVAAHLFDGILAAAGVFVQHQRQHRFVVHGLAVQFHA